MTTGSIRADIDGHLGILTIDRPGKLNALTLEMVSDLRMKARAFDEDPQVWVILLRSVGDRAFCAGGDLYDLIPKAVDAGGDVMNPNPAARYFSDVFTPVIASVQGVCLGGGFELFLGADIRIVSDRATFGLPEVGIGMIAGSGSNVMLPRHVPWVHAMALMLGGETIDAPTALSIGLVNEVVPHEQLEERTLEWARKLERNAPLAMRTAKEIALRSMEFERSFVLEHALNARVITSRDAELGIAAFRSRSTPSFENR